MAGLHLPDSSLDDCGEARPVMEPRKMSQKERLNKLWFIPLEALNLKHEDKPKREGLYAYDRLTCKVCSKTFHKSTGLALHLCLDGTRPVAPPLPDTRNTRSRAGAASTIKVVAFGESEETAIKNIKTLGGAKEKAEEEEVQIVFEGRGTKGLLEDLLQEDDGSGEEVGVLEVLYINTFLQVQILNV
jgi:hypothetical protein